MPRLRIIVLDQPDPNNYRYALWADVPAARQAKYANPTAASAWPGATAADLAALQAGAVVERVDTMQFPPGTPIARAQQSLIDAWNTFQAALTAGNPWKYYGTTWDGTAWAVAGVA